MAIETVQTLVVDVTTGTQVMQEVEMDIPNPRISEIERRLQEIRVALQSTDYKQAKYLDGDYTEEQYAPIRDERKALRVEYNALEVELASL
jgi:hypothetical protein